MERDRVFATLFGFLGALLLLGTLVYVAGIEAFVAEISRADTRLVVLVVLSTLGWLAAWGIGLRTVLAVMGVETSVVQAFLVLNGAMFSNNVTPFGQAGGEPIAALLISKSTGTEYERGLAAIASLDTLNFVPSISLALLGSGYYATQVTLDRSLRVVTAGVALLALLVPVVGYAIWRNRESLRSLALRVLTPTFGRIGGVIPGVSPPTRRSIAARLEHFGDAVERVGTSRRGLTCSLAASAIGWGFQMLALGLAFEAVGASVPITVLLFVVPVGAVASITPLPGGVGGIETVLVGLLSSLPGVGLGLETVLAAVVIFRGAVYWVPVAIGGVVMSLILPAVSQ